MSFYKKCWVLNSIVAAFLCASGVWAKSPREKIDEIYKKQYEENLREYSKEYAECGWTDATRKISARECMDAETKRQEAIVKNELSKLIVGASDYQKGLLEISQRNWAKYRDSECAFWGAQISGGPQGIISSSQADDRAQCLLRITRDRAKSLSFPYNAG